ncbi:hypothetical protein [Leucobacter chromiireducens]|uniref:hypothetical protein n=1 Tax=Leucobacter chromiireducens TaxID=283877 RepID=UPI003F816CFA
MMVQPGHDEQLQLVRALFPSLARDFESMSAPAAGSGAAAEFDAWLDREAGAVLAGAAFTAITDPAVAGRFDTAFARARAAARLLEAELPEPEAFAAAGSDLGHFGELLGDRPDLVPVPAPYGLGIDRWRAAFTRAGSAHPDVLKSADGVSPLILAADAERGFDALDRIPEGAGPLPVVAQRPSSGAVARWTLRLVPGQPTPSVLGLGFAHGPHVSLPELLMLQLMRILAGEQPIDTGTFTWLAGSIADGRLAARHVYDAGERVIRITCRETGNQGPHLGSRAPLA